MSSYKIKDKKTGKYKLSRNGVDSVNSSLGTVNGRTLYFSANDVEAVKANEVLSDESAKRD